MREQWFEQCHGAGVYCGEIYTLGLNSSTGPKGVRA